MRNSLLSLFYFPSGLKDEDSASESDEEELKDGKGISLSILLQLFLIEEDLNAITSIFVSRGRARRQSMQLPSFARILYSTGDFRSIALISLILVSLRKVSSLGF